MELNTRHFGVININEDEIINFPEGLPGFESAREFVLLGNESNYPFRWLQSVNDSNLAFVVIDPKLFRPDYEVDVDDKEVEELDIKDPNNVLVCAIVVVPEDIRKMTANLLAPVLINTENNVGKQILLDKGGYQIKHNVFEELRKIGGAK